jgi:hypothetical protein
MLLDCVMLEQRNTALAMAECIELQDIIFKTATISLYSMRKCLELQKICFIKATVSTLPF